MENGKTSWTNCKTFGIRFYDPRDINSFPEYCNKEECFFCMNEKLAIEAMIKQTEKFERKLLGLE